jgi:RHS repeat-associated protein
MTLPNGVTATYNYDDASQLTGLSYATAAGPLGNLTYAYDMAGRRVSVGGTLAQTNLPSPVSLTAYNADNQLTTWGTANLFYDANGNMISDGTNSFVWNARNKLASMNFTANSFQYDPFGRRQAKTISGTTTNYLYDGVNVAQELSGTTPTANLLSGGVDEVFTRTDSSGTANFVTDALGSTLALTNGSGSTVASYAYDPFGNTTQTGTSANSYQYASRENDGTGLYFNRARYYNPQLQRFISADPIGFKGGINDYAYVGGSPTNFVDPAGLDKQGFFGRIKSVNSCAATLSQKGSLTNLLGVPAFIGTNTAGDISGLLTGAEDDGGGPSASDNPTLNRLMSFVGDVAVHSLPEIANYVGVGSFTSVATHVSSFPGVYNPVSSSEVAIMATDTTIGAAVKTLFEGVIGAKMVFDAGVYIGALVVCARD